ncbi:heme lyase CcmF/NrfE family subunit [Ruegeria sp. 2205SS24-7]|uniref:heme lyase CcmF/NrfE family subunit n=1 Tax=Ruegeria discodermiae TaxID=3064389 RepID=UPI0027423127|nr:heme lyase CcmF/NrfE family subunit [Ruegeria sp. 2205SS24-7]MDP5220112.1 heme lyase CcmF/NrfE family subunit [Ruegeria sp. 2205SS24-7]
MIVELGHFALILALVASIIQACVPLWGMLRGNASAMQVADRAAEVQFLGIATAFGALTYAFVVSDFSVRIAALNSHSAKPMLYKVTGVWANHEGSMLLWVLMLALFGVLISLFGRMIPVRMRSTVLSVQGMIGIGFYLFILLTSNPFERVAMPPLDGQGMNPLLQDPGVAFHPPLLYLGYVGFSTAFSFAVAALITGRIDPAWARWMRPWILIAWSGLTAGIALGSWWAYYELGWGGFWFWDPVENASFMPWLIGTALLHSAIVVEKRNALLKWTILLAILTFSLSLIGTFLVRSGILTSVHAFATDPERGAFILLLLALYIGAALVLFAWRSPQINEGGVFAIWSRETGLLVNNLLMAAGCGVVFVGTLYPLALELINGAKISVGAPYFNQAFLPIFGIAMLAAGIGPFLSWKRARRAVVLRRAALTAIVAAAVLGLVLLVAGLRDPVGLLGVFIALWLAVATLQDLAVRIGLPGVKPDVALRRIIGLPRSAWGLYLGHGGLAIAAAGVIAVSVWKSEVIQTVQPGERIAVGPYAFVLDGIENTTGPNYQTSIATVEVFRDGTLVSTLKPERRWYPVEQKPTTEAGIRTLWHGDLYAVLGDPNGGGGFVMRYYYNPGVPWMWLGALLISLSALVSLSDRRLRVGAPSRSRAALQPAE